MKKIAITVLSSVLVSLAGSGIASAQGKYGADSADCIKYLSYYQEYFKQKNYDEALPNWRKAYKFCPPTANQNMLINGTVLLRRVIAKNASNPTYKQALIDSLMTIHDTRAQYYPKYAVTSLNNKGTDMINFVRDDNEALYKGLNEIIALNQEQTKSSILMLDLKTAIDLYQAGKLNPEEVINTYQRNLALLEHNSSKSAAEQEQDAKVKSDMEGLFITSKVASCDNLIALFTPRYEANPNDLDLVTNIVKMLSSTDDCTDNDLYLKAATSMHQLQPSAQSAYFLYRLNASKDNFNEAVKYIEEAIASPDLDNATMADYNYQLAAYCVKNGKNDKAFAAAQKAIELDGSYAGKCYYLIGSIWSTVTCGGDEIQKRAKYWVACDYMQKAKAADPTLADDCNSMIGQFSVYFPKTEDAFMYDLTDGQSYSISCGGMRATTTVRTQK